MTPATNKLPSALLMAALLALFSANTAAQDDIHRWKDAQGNIHYSDRPPPDSKTEIIDAANQAPAPALSYATRKAVSDFPVTLYTADNCKQVCAEARELLNKRQVPFSESPLTTQADLDNFRKRFGPRAGVPVMTVGATALTGFEPVGWNRQLDLAGYPKK